MLELWGIIITKKKKDSSHHCILTSYVRLWRLWTVGTTWHLQRSCRTQLQKSSLLSGFLLTFAFSSRANNDRVGGIADTSPSMCENKSAQGWRPVCLQQSWKFQWPRHGRGLLRFNKGIPLHRGARHAPGADFCIWKGEALSTASTTNRIQPAAHFISNVLPSPLCLSSNGLITLC